MKENDLVGDQDQSVDRVEDETKTIPYANYQKLLAQRKADQEKNRQLAQRLEEFEKKAEMISKKELELNEQKLRDEGNWKSLLESRETRLKELEEKLKEASEINNEYKNKFTSAHKLNAFKEAIGGTLRHNDYYSFVDLNKIALDPETGLIDEKSLKQYSNEFVSKHKELINFKSGKLPSEAGTSIKVGGKDLKTMSAKEIESELRKLGKI